MLPKLSAALQPHLAQQKQNVPAGSHMCANFLLACLDDPLLVSKEMSKSHLHPRGVFAEKHYFCIRKRTAERRELGCAGHRAGPGIVAGVSVILKVATTGRLLWLPLFRSHSQGGLCPVRGRDGLGSREAGDLLPTPG